MTNKTRLTMIRIMLQATKINPNLSKSILNINPENMIKKPTNAIIADKTYSKRK